MKQTLIMNVVNNNRFVSNKPSSAIKIFKRRRSKKVRGDTKTNSRQYDIDDPDPMEKMDLMDISDENQIVSGRRESLAWRQISKNNGSSS